MCLGFLFGVCFFFCWIRWCFSVDEIAYYYMSKNDRLMTTHTNAYHKRYVTYICMYNNNEIIFDTMYCYREKERERENCCGGVEVIKLHFGHWCWVSIKRKPLQHDLRNRCFFLLSGILQRLRVKTLVS